MQKISSGINRTSSHDGRIIVYTVSSLGVATLKNWSDDIVASLENWPEDNDHYLTLYDLSSHGVSLPYLVLTGYNIYNLGITPAGQKRVDHVLQSRPSLKIKLALVLSPSVSGDIAVRRGRQPSATDAQIDYQVYFDQTDAHVWLEQFLST